MKLNAYDDEMNAQWHLVMGDQKRIWMIFLEWFGHGWTLSNWVSVFIDHP